MQGSYDQQANHLFGTLIPAAMERLPNLQLGDIAVLYPAASFGDSLAAAAAAQEHGFGIIRADTNAIYPRSSRIMRWLEQCAIWCCAGWQTGLPRFSRIVGEGTRKFSEALASEDAKLQFQRALISFLSERRDSTLDLHTWLTGFHHGILQPYFAASRTLVDESATLDAFILRTGPGQDCEAFTLGLFCGHGAENDRINLSTLHSSKGLEFRVVILFGMDAGKIPWSNQTEGRIKEWRRLFYVGFTRAKDDVHILFSSNNPSPFVTELKRRLDQNL